MISEALELITEELNLFLGRKEPSYRNANTVVLSDLVNQAGEFIITLNDTQPRDNLIVTLINVEEETVGKAQFPYIKNSDRSITIANPELKLNLYVLFSAFSNMQENERYRNCLRLIDYAVRFFQSKSVFNHQNSPNLSPEIEKLILELISITFEQQNYLWGTLGAKHMPSVLYKLRLLTIRELDDSLEGTAIEEIQKDEKVLW